MARPRVVTVGPLVTADPDGIAQSQTPGAAGNLTLNGVLAGVLDVPRRILVTTVADESGKTLTIYGTNRNGDSISEVMTGPAGTTGYTAQDFKTVTRVAVSAAFTGAVTVGTNGVASSPWLNVNYHNQAVNIGIGVEVSGTINYTVQSTYDEVFGHYEPGVPGNYTPGDAAPAVYDDPVGGSTANDEFQILSPVRAVRLTVNSSTNPAYAVMTLIEAGIIG